VTSRHRQSGFDCAVCDGFDIAWFADNGPAKRQRIFVTNIFIKPLPTDLRDRMNQEQ
jgi:hypothetical protein